MPRDLGDVIHYFIPEAGKAPEPEAPRSHPQSPPSQRTAPQRPQPEAREPEAPPVSPGAGSGGPPAPAAAGDAAGSRAPSSARRPLAVLGVPLAGSDVLRAAFAWNLAVEIARRDAGAALVAPREAEARSLWPEPGRGPLGAELLLVERSDGDGLAEAARATAARLAAQHARGVVLAAVPLERLEATAASPAAPRWWLLFSTPDPQQLAAARALALAISAEQPGARIGVAIHAVRRVDEARDAFDSLARATDPVLAQPLASYGLLVDDLHVYRAIVARRPIGLAHPQAPASRALADVAHWLLEDADDEAAHEAVAEEAGGGAPPGSSRAEGGQPAPPDTGPLPPATAAAVPSREGADG